MAELTATLNVGAEVLALVEQKIQASRQCRPGREQLAECIHDSLFMDAFRRTTGAERALYLQAADAVLALWEKCIAEKVGP